MYVLVPEQTGSAPTTGPEGVTGSPHEFVTDGGVGTTCALLIHATVAEPAAGTLKVGALIIYVYTHCAEVPVQSVYVHVYVLFPEHTGSAPSTGVDGVIVAPQEFITDGGVGTTCASMIQATVEELGAGRENVGAEME